MKKLTAFLAAFIPFLGAAEFDSTVHFQIGTKYPEETSHMKLTGNIYDFLPDSQLMWVISPKIYLNPSVPVDFAGSAGLKYPVGSMVVGYHAFGHFHNFGDFPVNQFGHTLELIHNIVEAKVNYYHAADGVFPLSAGILSSQRIDSEFTVKLSNAALTAGPVYQFDKKIWGAIGRVAMVFDAADAGIEVYKAPGSDAQTSFFMTFKFPNKSVPKIAPKGNSSSHYTNFSLQGPQSTSATSNDKKKPSTVATSKEDSASDVTKKATN